MLVPFGQPKQKLTMSHPQSNPVRRQIGACIAILGATFFPISYLAAAATPSTPGGPTVTVNEPVAVTLSGPVQVQGVVEVINDVLRPPYRIPRVGSSSGASAQAGFVVPQGKRLIVETVSVEGEVPVNQSVRLSMVTQATPPAVGGNTSIFLPLQRLGTFGGKDVFAGTHSMTLRVDPRSGGGILDQFDSAITFILERNGTGGTVNLTVSVNGYLIDIP
jgi:hypothetical protein